jgi:hypothetical protein
MAIIDIEVLKEKFGPGDSPRSADYIDLIETLADDRNAVYYANTSPEDTEANRIWFNTSSEVLYVYFNDDWVGIGEEQGIPGDSAYQVAVDNGFVGNEEAWLTSLIGPQGNIGPQGDMGSQGIQGLQGNTGPQGPEGPQGIQGIQGIQGNNGPQGPQGEQGPQGIQGQAGASVTLKGSVDELVELPSSNNTPGDSYINQDDGNLYVWTGSEWFDAGQIVGPQGPQGIQGIQGNTGPQGEQGIQGDQGPQGTQGIQGNTGPQGESGLVAANSPLSYNSEEKSISIDLSNYYTSSQTNNIATSKAIAMAIVFGG